MTHDEQRALLVEFGWWMREEPGVTITSVHTPVGMATRFLAARQPQAAPCDCASCQAGQTYHVTTTPPARPLDTTLYHAARGEPSAREGWVWVLDEPPDAATLARQIEPADPALAAQIRTDAGRDGAQRFWRVFRLSPGECWQMVIVSGDGKPVGGTGTHGTCYYERDYTFPSETRKMAEADGAASGLPEWKP